MPKQKKSQRQKLERTCVACRRLDTKSKMLRISSNKQGEINLDIMQKLDGRGCYVCPSQECITVLNKQKSLNRAFRCAVSQAVYDDITNHKLLQ